MPDWKQIVYEHTASAGLQIPPEVVAELAAHLEDDYEEKVEAGLVESEAERSALAGVQWRSLTRRVNDAKINDAKTHRYVTERNIMNPRTKVFWLCALASITFTAVLLIIFDRVHAGPFAIRLGHLAMALQLAWFATMALLGQTKLEEALMNQRTRSIWLPGFVSLTAASLFMFAAEVALAHDPSFYFTDASLRPTHLISGLPRWIYFGWLLAQVLCGALGAFLSRRAGGSRLARVVAGSFPALMMFLLCGLVIPASAFAEHNAFVLGNPVTIAMGVAIWVAIPALPLLLGAAPFLGEPALQRA